MRLTGAVPVCLLAVAFLSSCGASSYDDGYKIGYESGYDETMCDDADKTSFWHGAGYAEGYESGRDDGASDSSYDDGYDDGYNGHKPEDKNDPDYMCGFKDGRKKR